MTEKKKGRKKDKEPKQTVPRAERRRRAEEKRHKLHSEILNYMASQAKVCRLPSGNLAITEWARKGDEYVNNLIKKRPQESELIRQVGARAAKSIEKSVEVADTKRTNCIRAYFEVIQDAIDKQGLSKHPEVNMEWFRELVEGFRAFLLVERPEHEKSMILNAAVFVLDNLKTKLKLYPKREQFLFSLAKETENGERP